jgi:hypothetical protein
MPHHKQASYSGTVEHVFAHRFVLRADDGYHLVDLTPEGADTVELAPGLRMTVHGEQKPSELKAQRIAIGDREIEIPHKHGPGYKKPHRPAHDHDTAPALKSVRAQGYEVLAPPRNKPKHLEILARGADGRVYELHVELDGHVRKAKHGAADDAKWAEQSA